MLEGVHAKAQERVEGTSAKEIREQGERVLDSLASLVELLQIQKQERKAKLDKVGKESQKLTKIGGKYLVSSLSKAAIKLLHWLKEFLTKERHLFPQTSNTASAKNIRPRKSWREGVWETITSLKDFIFKRSQGKASISEEIAGSKQAQAQKFLKLLNTPVGETVPMELAKIKVTVEGQDLIEVDRRGKVVVNEIQPLMATATVTAAIERDLVELPNAPDIEPIPGSLAAREIGIQSEVLAASDLDEMVRAAEWAGLSEADVNSMTFDNEPDYPHSSEILERANEPETTVPIDPKLGRDLATVAWLHQIATPSDTPTLTLVDESGNEAATITQTISSEGDATYDLRSGDSLTQRLHQRQLSFTIDAHGIPANLSASNPDRIAADLQQVVSIATSATNSLQLAPKSEIGAVATASEMVKTLAELEINEGESTVIDIDERQLEIDIDRETETMRIVDPATLDSMQFSKGRGIENRGLLKSLLDGGIEGGSSLAQKLIDRATERAQIARQAVAKATTSVGNSMSEHALKAAEGGAIAAIASVKTAGEKIGNLVGAAREIATGSNRPVVGTIADIQTQEKAELIRPESIFDLLEAELETAKEPENSDRDPEEIEQPSPPKFIPPPPPPKPEELERAIESQEPPQGFKPASAPPPQSAARSLNL